jgi:hypothetical protein
MAVLLMRRGGGRNTAPAAVEMDSEEDVWL